ISFHDAGRASVEQDVGVQVAVTSMEDVAELELVSLGDPGDVGHDVDELAARDDCVDDVVTGSYATEGAERLFATLPQLGSLGVADGLTHVARATFLADLAQQRGVV